MASTLTRVTTFVPATPILSAEANSELNQILNLLNGTSSNIKAVIKVSDAGDPALELNQLSTGPIQEWFQGGILKASVNNLGQLVSALTTGTAPFVVASTTVVTNLNADLLDGLHQSDFIRFVQEEGSSLTQRQTINFIGSGVTAADNAGQSRTDISLHAQLNSLANVGSNGMLARSASNTITPRTITGTANQISVSNGDGAAGNPTLSTPQDIHTGASPTFANLTTSSNVTVGSQLSVTGKAVGFLRRIMFDASGYPTSGTSQTNLAAYTIPAGTLPSGGDYLRFKAGFSATNADNANAESTFRVVLAGTEMLNTVVKYGITTGWASIEVTIFRVTATTARCIVDFVAGHIGGGGIFGGGGGTGADTKLIDVTVSDLSSNTNVLQFTGQVNDNDSSITQTLLIGEYVQG